MKKDLPSKGHVEIPNQKIWIDFQIQHQELRGFEDSGKTRTPTLPDETKRYRPSDVYRKKEKPTERKNSEKLPFSLGTGIEND